MKLHLFHFSPHGLVRAYSHLIAGRRLCRSTGMKLRPLIPESVNSMTAAYNVYRTLQEAELPWPETLIDVGANVSQMARLLLGMNANAKVISCEPNPKLSPIGEVMRIAISDTDGEADFFIPMDDTGWGTIEAGKDNISTNTNRFPVTINRMDTLIRTGKIPWDNLKQPIMVKIDTEGSEKRVIDGFGKYLSDVEYLLVEVENIEQRGQNYNLLGLSTTLASHGFDQCKIVYACYDGPDAPAYTDVLFWRK
ncbi:MAG: FkbM family methyltransferase [Lawsonibacter sp.]|jgi:FkbM family methyltransferase